MKNEELEVLVVEDGFFNDAKMATDYVNSMNTTAHISVLRTAGEAYNIIQNKPLNFLLTDLLFEEEIKNEILRGKYFQICDQARDYAFKHKIPFAETRNRILELDDRMRKGKKDQGDKEQFALGNVLFFEALEKKIPACIFTSTHRHESFIDGTYLVAPLAAKGLLIYEQNEPAGPEDWNIGSKEKKVEHYEIQETYPHFGGKRYIYEKVQDLPILVLDAQKNVPNYVQALNVIIKCLTNNL